MKNIKRLAATAATAAVMAFGLTVPAAADATSTNTCDNSGVGSTTCASSATDSSTTYTVNGNCSGIITSSVSGDNSSASTSTATSTNLGGGNSSASSSNTTTQGNSSAITFAPNCSTNVTQQVARAPRVAAQVVAPTGGVHAGAGGALAGTSNVPSIVGLAGSIGTAGIGLALRRKAQLEV